MRYTTALSNLTRIKQLKRRTFVLAILSLLLNLCLVWCLMWIITSNANNQRTVLVPPVIEERFWVSQQQYSNSYLAQMSVFFAQLRFNATAHSGQVQHDLLLSYVHPKAYDTLKQQLNREQEARSLAQLNSMFYPISIDIDTQQQSATLSGDLWQMVDGQALPVMRKHYQINTSYQQGRLFITAFRELTDED